MRGRLGRFLLASVVGTFHISARAQGTETLHVERTPGAEACPDGFDLAQRVAAIRGRPQISSSADYEVEFSRRGDTFSAAIRGGRSGESQRVLSGRGTCSALAQATAVTLALLFDSEAERASSPEPSPAPVSPPRAENRVTASAAPAPVSPRAPLNSTLSLGVAGLAFVLRPLSPAFTGELGLRFTRFRAGLGVLWNPTQSLPLDSGQMNVSLLSGSARACITLTRVQPIQIDICSGLFAGAITAEADGAGISDNAARTRPYLALPLELSLAEFSPPFAWEVSASALAALAHPDFQVEGLPPAYRAPRVGAMLTFRVFALSSW